MTNMGFVSDGAFNAAVAVGISVMGLSSRLNLWIYFVAEFVDAALTVAALKAIDPGDI
jgi:hypothetical protein